MDDKTRQLYESGQKQYIPYYTVLYSNSLDTLIGELNFYIFQRGYIPTGGIAVLQGHTYYQAMMKIPKDPG